MIDALAVKPDFAPGRHGRAADMQLKAVVLPAPFGPINAR